MENFVEVYSTIVPILEKSGPIAIGTLFVLIGAFLSFYKRQISAGLTWSAVSIPFFAIAIFLDLPKLVVGSVEGLQARHTPSFNLIDVPGSFGTNFLPVYWFHSRVDKRDPISNFIADSKIPTLDIVISGRRLRSNVENEFCSPKDVKDSDCGIQDDVFTRFVVDLGPADGQENNNDTIKLSYDPKSDQLTALRGTKTLLVNIKDRKPEGVKKAFKFDRSIRYGRSGGFLIGTAHAREKSHTPLNLSDLLPGLNSSSAEARRSARSALSKLAIANPTIIEGMLISDNSSRLELIAAIIALRDADVGSETLSQESVTRLIEFALAQNFSLRIQALIYLRTHPSDNVTKILEKIIADQMIENDLRRSRISRLGLEVFYNYADSFRQKFQNSRDTNDLDKALKYYEKAWDQRLEATEDEMVFYAKAQYGSGLINWFASFTPTGALNKYDFVEERASQSRSAFKTFLEFVETHKAKRRYLHDHHLRQAKSCLDNFSPKCVKEFPPPTD